MERMLLIRHNWHDRDESKWLFWLEKKLTELGFNVSMAPLPEAAAKDTVSAVGEIQAVHAIMPQNTYIVRHDPGCLTLLKYCEQLLTKRSAEPTLLIAGIPKRSYDKSFSVLKMIGGPKALKKIDKENNKGEEMPEYVPDPNQLTLQTIDVKLMVVYGGELHKALR